MTVRIRLLGQVCIEQDGQPPTDLPAKALDLLCSLLLRRDRTHTRDELSAMLWPDTSTTAARKYLRQTLWQLQSALTADLLLLRRGWVGIDAGADWWLDVDTFERAWEASREVPGTDMTSTQAHELEEAVAELKEKGVAIDFLYTGPSVANTDEEVSIIDDLVAQKPDAIIIAASDADKLVPVAKKAKDSGIKVITYDGDVADPDRKRYRQHEQVRRLEIKVGEIHRANGLRRIVLIVVHRPRQAMCHRDDGLVDPRPVLLVALSEPLLRTRSAS